MNRRNFIQAFPALAGFLGLASSCKNPKIIKGSIVGASAKVGHLLRDKKFELAGDLLEKDVVIIGAGVSGLSAAKHLKQSGVDDFILLDLEEQTGGNATSGKNTVSAYPWGAHYVPLPNNSLTEYMAFLKECNVITGFSEQGLPVYNEYHLCFDPQERLYINGRWQDGLVPHYGVPEKEKKEIERFLQLMDDFRHSVGEDGKDAFAIPVNNSSSDQQYIRLDSITMEQWLHEQGFTSAYLNRYVNYCTRDDFGTSLDVVSAWAGIHYFACRKGIGANANHSDVLTWPEGNGWLVKQLEKGISGNIKTGALVTSVKPFDNEVIITYFDVATRQLQGIKARQCIMAIQQFVASRLLSDYDRLSKVSGHMQYVPWVVANLTVKGLEERSGASLSWDNVRFESDSLGYVEATHESVQRFMPRRNLTWYLPLTGQSPAEERKLAQAKTHAEWVKQIIDDLKIIHPNIEEALEEVNIMLWGHAMVQPRTGWIHGEIRTALSAPVAERIHFAHTDVASVSLFEEAFYQGLSAAKTVMQNLSQV